MENIFANLFTRLLSHFVWRLLLQTWPIAIVIVIVVYVCVRSDILCWCWCERGVCDFFCILFFVLLVAVLSLHKHISLGKTTGTREWIMRCETMVHMPCNTFYFRTHIDYYYCYYLCTENTSNGYRIRISTGKNDSRLPTTVAKWAASCATNLK